MDDALVKHVAHAIQSDGAFCTLAEDAGCGDKGFESTSLAIARTAIMAMREYQQQGDKTDGQT